MIVCIELEDSMIIWLLVLTLTYGTVYCSTHTYKYISPVEGDSDSARCTGNELYLRGDLRRQFNDLDATDDGRIVGGTY